MILSHFDHAEDNEPKQHEFTWESFASSLGPHDYRYRAKKSVPCFSPAEYDLGDPQVVRDDRFVKRLWQFVLDVDEVTEVTFHALVEYLQQLGLAAVVYSTWSHAEALATKGLWKFRVVVPLDAPVDAARWREFWAKANYGVFNGVGDPKCCNESRLYFGPFAPPGTEAVNFYFALPGAPLWTEAVFRLPIPEQLQLPREVAEQQKFRTNTQQAIQLLAAAWPAQRRHEAHLALAGGLLGSGYPDEAAVEFLCAVANAHDGSDEERDKRESAVQHTREQIDAGGNVTGWTTLASIVGYEVVEKVRALVEKPPEVTPEQLLRYAKVLKKSKHDQKSELGDALERVCTGRVFPEAIALRLAAELGARFVDYDPQSIASAFDASIKAMRKDGEGVSIAQLAARVQLKQDETRAAREESRKRIAEREKEILDDKAKRVREAYKNGRSHPYTHDELVSWHAQIGTGQRWVIQKDRSYYFFFNGSYCGPYSEAEAHNAALRELAPAASAGVTLTKVNKDGSWDFKSLKQIVAEYGTVADKVITDLRQQVVTYVEYDRAIIEAPCPFRKLEPVYDADVDRWMYEMVGPDNYDDIKTWFALLPNLDVLRSALSLMGAHSVGKSMGAKGASRIWTVDGPCMLEEAIAPFNDSMLRCPLVFADEHLPKDFKGNAQTEALRAFIQATERPLKRKHMPSSKLLGVTPLYIAGHDADMLRPQHDTNNDEIAGTMQRFLIMVVREAAAEFLANLRPTTHERGWVNQDVIAKHIWWLHYNHKHAQHSRFYFKPQSAERALWWASSGGAKGALLRWVVSYIADRRRFEGDGNTLMWVRIWRGHVLANIQGPLQFWDKYVGNEKCPSAGLMARLLASISYPDRLKLPNSKGRVTNYRVIRNEYLFTFADGTDIISADELDAELKVDSKEVSLGLVRRI